MKKRLLAMLLVLMMVVSLLPTGALADDGYYSNEFVTFEYDGAQGAITETKQYTVNLIKPDGSLLNSFTVPDYNRSDSHDNKLTLSGSISGEYEIDSISQDPGIISSSSINKSEVTYHSTFTGDSATLTVQLAEVFDESNVEINGGEVGHAGVVYFDVINYEILKMLYIAGENVSADTSIDSVTLRYVEDNLSLKTESFDILAGYNATEYVDYWQADASNAAYLATPYNVRQLEIEHDGVTTVIPYTELKFTRDGDHYWIEARNDAPYIVAFYNETSADSGNDYTLYDIRYVDISGETVAENGGMPADPKYPNTTYQFVAWTDGYDGGKPFIETTPVTEDTVVYAQKTLSTKASEIHVMNDGNLFKDRIQELYGRNDINWDSVKVSVYAEDGSYTNPDYSISPNANGWRDNYYFVYNYLSGVGEQENDPIFINDITHIVVTANAADGSELGPITINKGIYDGDFSVSTGAQGSSYIIELYINDNGVEDPGEEPGPEPVAKLDVDKTVAIPDGEGTAAVGDVLEYTVTITNLNSVAATGVKVTDTMWSNGGSVIINGTSYSVDSGSVTVDVPANGSVDIYYTYTVPETDAGKTVENTVTVGDMTITTSTAVDEAEEPEEPGKPSEPTEDELNQLYVVLDCINADAQHADKRFHLDQDNSYVTVDLTTGICTVQPNYDFILATYNEQVADGHTYADDAEKTLMLTWDGTNKTWIVAGDVASITRQVMCEPREVTVKFVDEATEEQVGDTYTLIVEPDAWNVNSSAIKSEWIPEGYELAYTGDFGIVNDVVEVPVRKLPYKILVSFWDENQAPIGGQQTVEVGESATPPTDDDGRKIVGWTNNGNAYEGPYDYAALAELVEANDGWNDYYREGYLTFEAVYERVITVKVVDKDTEENLGTHEMTVEADAIHVNTSAIPENWIPEGYELADVGDLLIENEVVTVTVRKIEVEPEPYYTIHIDFVDSDDTPLGGGDVISTAPDLKYPSVPTPTAEGMEFVGWQVLMGNSPMYEGEFTFNALKALREKLDGKITWSDNTTWITFKAVYEPIVYTIHIDFVDSDDTPLGGGDVISTAPDLKYPSVPTPTAEGMEFVGWQVLMGNSPMYEGEFTFNALKALREKLDGKITWSDNTTWITFKAVYKETPVEPEDAPSLYVTKYDDVPHNESVERGDVVKYTITVENTGNVDLTNVVVEDTLWENGTVIYVGDKRIELTGDSINFTFLPVGETITITYYYTVTRADEREGEIVNEVTVKAGDNVTDSDTEKTPVDDGWTPKPDDDDTVYVPNWLNTTDHYAYIVGYEDGTIRPQNNITRAEVATIFFRLLTDNARERYWSTTNDFSDIAAESWYNNAISTLSNMGIINGYEDGTFKPNAPITRAEFTAIATRFFDYEAEYDGAFNDVSARAWYADYVQAAVDMGLVDGYPDGGFHPDAYITRAEACTIVNRVLHRVPHEDHLLAESVMNTWPDNPKSAWYYEDMQEATNSHDYDWIRDDGETVEDWTKKLPERDWSALETEWATAYSR